MCFLHLPDQDLKWCSLMTLLREAAERKCWKENCLFPSHFHTCHAVHSQTSPSTKGSTITVVSGDAVTCTASQLAPANITATSSNLSRKQPWYLPSRNRDRSVQLVEVREGSPQSTWPREKERSLRVHSAETWNFNEKSRSTQFGHYFDLARCPAQ